MNVFIALKGTHFLFLRQRRLGLLKCKAEKINVFHQNLQEIIQPTLIPSYSHLASLPYHLLMYWGQGNNVRTIPQVRCPQLPAHCLPGLKYNKVFVQTNFLPTPTTPMYWGQGNNVRTIPQSHCPQLTAHCLQGLKYNKVFVQTNFLLTPTTPDKVGEGK